METPYYVETVVVERWRILGGQLTGKMESEGVQYGVSKKSDLDGMVPTGVSLSKKTVNWKHSGAGFERISFLRPRR